MDDQLKSKVIIAAIVLAAVCLILSISSGISASKNKTNLQSEMALRLETEEKLSSLDAKISLLEDQLKNTQETLNQTKTSLEQEQLVNQALKSELEKVNRLKEQLEKDLKEALVARPPTLSGK